MPTNLKLTYLYRDAGNYKKWNSVVFINPENLPVEDLRARICAACISRETFLAHQVRLPEVFLYLDSPRNEDDHCLHEFDGVAATKDKPSDTWYRTATEFLHEFEAASKSGWNELQASQRLAVY